MIHPEQTKTAIKQRGTRVTVRTRSLDSETGFGNPEASFNEDRTVWCVRTYPNRNTTAENTAGDLQRDRPVMMFPREDGAERPPEPGDRVDYNGTVYDMEAPTEYESHIEMFGEVVLE